MVSVTARIRLAGRGGTWRASGGGGNLQAQHLKFRITIRAGGGVIRVSSKSRRGPARRAGPGQQPPRRGCPARRARNRGGRLTEPSLGPVVASNAQDSHDTRRLRPVRLTASARRRAPRLGCGANAVCAAVPARSGSDPAAPRPSVSCLLRWSHGSSDTVCPGSAEQRRTACGQRMRPTGLAPTRAGPCLAGAAVTVTGTVAVITSSSEPEAVCARTDARWPCQ